MKDTVCFYSLAGTYSDSARAIYEMLLAQKREMEYVWIIQPGTQVPGPARTVLEGSSECWGILDHADFLVATTYLYGYTKNPSTRYLQTWHGTPLKQIAFDNPATNTVERQAALASLVDQWDYLVSPNAFSTHHLASAFQFKGATLETGYPRNDILFSTKREHVRQQVRRALGINPDERAVLYAPTFRDDVVDANGKYQAQLQLDLSQLLSKQTAPTQALLRLHSNLAPKQGDGPNVPGVTNVSAYPDIAELYLAADVLITDYSSSMFDFANTGKPMVFFPYDLQHYRDNVRGFYWDYETEAPGPLCFSSEEVIAAVDDLDNITLNYAERYAAFKARFCHLEDGSASVRVIDAVFGPS